MIEKFESGKWYVWNGGSSRPESWNDDGKMDFILDGKPHQCNRAGNGNGLFEDVNSASFFDSPLSNHKWNWELDKFDKVEKPEGVVEREVCEDSDTDGGTGSLIRGLISEMRDMRRDGDGDSDSDSDMNERRCGDKMIKEFKVGDKVKFKRNSSSNAEYFLGYNGIIENLEVDTICSVDELRLWTSDKKKRFYVAPKEVELMVKVKINPVKIVTFKPGMKMMDFVKKTLKNETDKERIKWLRTFENCVLPKDVEEMIEEALTVVLNKEKFDDWGINEHFEKGLTNSILLYGPPGTGKTMISEAFAAVLGMNLMKVSNADLQSNIPGKTEKNIADSFRQAKEKNCVVLLDECDSMLYDRNAVGAIMGSEINALLTEIENFEGVCILTTNRLHKLDAALQRRIIAKIELPKPCEKGRNLIWQKLLPKKMPVGELDFKELASYPLTGGEIKNSILIAARKAISKNDKKVEMSHLTDAAKFVLKSIKDFEAVQPKRIRENYGGGGDKKVEVITGKKRTKI